MQLSTSKDALLTPLSLVTGAADPRGTIPMLATVLLKAGGGRLSMLCSDAGLVARSAATCSIDADGEIAVDARRFSDLVRAIPDTESLQMSLEDGGKLLVKAGRSRFRLPTFPAADFPKLKPDQAERVAVTVPVKRLAEMLEQVTPAMAQADLRAYLNGTLLALQDGHLWVVATDGYRLAVAREPVAGTESIAPTQVILPRKTITLARKLLGQVGDVKVTLGATDAQFAFQDGSLVFGKGIDGKFPDWMRVIPTDGECASVTTARLAEGIAMLEAASVAADSTGVRVVEVGFEKHLMTLVQGDSARSELDAECSGAETKVAFNIDFLKDAVYSIGKGQDKLRLFYQGPQKPLVLRPLGSDFPLSVVMSYRT